MHNPKIIFQERFYYTSLFFILFYLLSETGNLNSQVTFKAFIQLKREKNKVQKRKLHVRERREQKYKALHKNIEI